jgi:hypothetical protein
MPWIIDGSNVGGVLAGAAGARDRALVWRTVFAWAGGRRQVVLVFDGAAEPAIPDRLGGVEVRWATGRAADEVVRRTVARKAREWRVVTDDRALREACRDLGAKVMGVREWLGPPRRAPTTLAEPKGEPDVDVDDWLAWFRDSNRPAG